MRRRRHRPTSALRGRMLILFPLVGAILWVPTAIGHAPPVRDAPPASESGVRAGPEGAADLPPLEGGSPRAQPERLQLVFTGDVLIHQPVWEAAAEPKGSDTTFNFRPMFAPVRGVLRRADLAICHLETPLTFDDGRLSSYPVFNVPADLADALAWAGYDGCSTASNHALDQGVDGVGETLKALEAAGLRHAGTARSEREARRLTMYRMRGTRIGHLSYTYGLNGFVPDRPWRVGLLDPRRILRDARRARAAGSDFTVVSLHWGQEYISTPTTDQERLARVLTRAKAIDLVVGHHAHVPQPVRRLHGTWVAYGLGNFLSNQSGSGVQDGAILRVVVEKRGARLIARRVRYTPTWVDQGRTWKILPVRTTLERGAAVGPLRDALHASWRRTTDVMGETLVAR